MAKQCSAGRHLQLSAPSYKDVNAIWAGTDDGLVHVTRDGGKTWKTSRRRDDTVEQGLADRCRPLRRGHGLRRRQSHASRRMEPIVYRTHDFGKTWRRNRRGIAGRSGQRRARGPRTEGPALCGTEREVYVSFNDGETGSRYG